MSRNARQKREARNERRDETRDVSPRSTRRNQPAANEPQKPELDIQYKPAATRPLEALTPSQEIHKSSLLHEEIVVSIGSAGTGKTYLSAAVAAELYKNGMVKKIVVSRPPVEVGQKLGYLPGDIDDKFAPYLEPFKAGLIDRLGSNKFKSDYKSKILPKPLAYMRGDTFDDAVLLLDEAQNTTVEEMKMFLTRAGVNSRIFISGDVNQTDLKGKVTGLAWLVRQIEKRNTGIDLIQYDREDCVRSGLCKRMLDLIEEEV